MKHKKITLLLALWLMAVAVNAQQSERFDPAKDKREMNGYTIHLIPSPGNSFGFDILKGNKPVYVQLSNPFTHSPSGFKSKEDAYKLAEWVVNENIKNGRSPQHIPPELAKQLNLPSGVPNIHSKP